VASNCSSFLLLPLSLCAYNPVPTLDRAIEAGGEGPPGLSPDDPLGGNPFIVPFEPLEMGGEASCPRLLGEYGESLSRPFWYFEIPDHSLSPTETGDKGPFRPFIVL
jgi:hypothetical protein